jgi:diaminohydroxyphosphoribosylaminopyrimidine deaminase/5-amino-6-(5-phosphoribosylamino)uracil reductase|tara:strand:- start:39 stop:1103 length:1065 start_codon:yes stop_codon:yes gene_type:complete
LFVNDSEYMRRALELAESGVGLTSPNPPVGAVIVKGGEELGVGWHRAAGQPHAEVEALKDAVARHGMDAARGATVYVTLEPCCTQGRTGPCTTALVQAGVRRVVIGASDPNPAHGGKAAGILSKGGIEVVEGIEEAGSEELIRAFAKVQRTGLPWVIIKSALSLDGRITRTKGEGQWLSGPGSRAEVQDLRGEVDAILSSGETVRADNPRFTLRGDQKKEGKRQPWRVILTSSELGLPREAEIFTDAFADRTLVYKGQRIECVLRELVSDHGVVSVLVEAGGRLVGRLLDEGWADEVVFYLAPLLTGGPIPASGGEGVAELRQRVHLDHLRFQQIENDVRLRAILAGTSGELER